MSDRHEPARRRLEEAVLQGPAHLDPAVRSAIASGREAPAELLALVARVKDEAYRVTDADLDALRLHYDEDELFEVVVSAALGAGLTRLQAALSALDKA